MIKAKVVAQLLGPIGIAGGIVALPVSLNWFSPEKVKGISTVAESMINIASINIGLFAAIIGVVVAFWDRTVFIKMRRSGETQFQFFALEAMALIGNFLLLMSTLAVQVRSNFNNLGQGIILSVWLVMVILALYFTFQALLIMFKTVIYADEQKQVYMK